MSALIVGNNFLVRERPGTRQLASHTLRTLQLSIPAQIILQVLSSQSRLHEIFSSTAWVGCRRHELPDMVKECQQKD